MLALPVLGTGLLGQLLKFLFHSARRRRWRLSRLADFESFPSLHPLLAGGLCYQVAEATGWASVQTAVVLGFTGVVLYDTAGVKRAAGRQAEMIRRLSPRQALSYSIDSLLGQSPVQAWITAFAGILLSLLLERALLALRTLS
jgi:acid phosphatase family membrane protein YuiD